MNGKECTSSGFAYNHQDFAFVLSKYKYNLHLGDITAGTIFSEEPKGFLVDIGASISAYLPKDEASINKYNYLLPSINDTREFFILAYNKKSNQLIVSIKRLEYIRGWQRIKQMHHEDIVLDLYIHKINKGGVLTVIEGIQGFIPNSHIVNFAEKAALLHKKLSCQFLLANERTNKLIFSHKRAFLKNMQSFLHVGQIVQGKIVKIASYGVFVEVHGFLALLHMSEINNSQSQEIYLLELGKLIIVQVIHIDRRQGRLSVSMRNLN